MFSRHYKTRREVGGRRFSYNELVRGGDLLDQSIPCPPFAQRALRAGTWAIRVGCSDRREWESSELV